MQAVASACMSAATRRSSGFACLLPRALDGAVGCCQIAALACNKTSQPLFVGLPARLLEEHHFPSDGGLINNIRSWQQQLRGFCWGELAKTTAGSKVRMLLLSSRARRGGIN